MEEISDKDNQLSILNSIKDLLSNSKPDKGKARDIVSKLDSLTFSFTVKFKSINLDFTTKTYIQDATEHLNTYIESNLKKKDNIYFDKGLKDANTAIRRLIKEVNASQT